MWRRGHFKRYLPSHPPSAGALPKGEPFLFLNLMVLDISAPFFVDFFHEKTTKIHFVSFPAPVENSETKYNRLVVVHTLEIRL